MDEIEKLTTPRGEGRAMHSLAGGFPMSDNRTGADWFGPGAPMMPVAPSEVAGRVLDYQTGYNLATQPRDGDDNAIPFAMLRALADSYDPLRLIIDRRIDQMARLNWVIRVRHDGVGKRPKTAALPPATRERISEITRFFKQPARDLNWRSWLRAVLEDHYVIDAPSLYCSRHPDGELRFLQPVDGALVKRVIDPWGLTPAPIPYVGGSFTWGNIQITPNNLAAHGFRYDRARGWLLPPAYQMNFHGVPAIALTQRDLVYAPARVRTNRIYGTSQVEVIAQTINIAMRRVTSQLEHFREGNIPEALFALPESWTPDQVGRFQQYWDDLFSGNLGNRRRMKFIGGGDKDSYIPLKEPPLKNEFDEWLVRIICFAFSYPPAAFVSLQNKSIAEQHDRTSEEEGLQSTATWLSDVINKVIDDELDSSGEIEFAWVEEDEIDQSRQSEILNAYATNGVLTLNEVRERLGEEPSPDPAANQLMVKTATGYVPIGGSNGEPKDVDR
ncbi:phage portal protein [Bradyrhizobium sp. B124]|uniref:phage portal protein n=1 Tax=Bradyrhizobium sp. B124 TaxID=3140245 RepID=UPI0031833D5B